MLKLYRLLGMLLVALLFAACEKAEEPSYQTEAAAKMVLNVPYGADPKQVVDVYLPPNRTSNTSVIIFVHGGSFVSGDKNNFTAHAIYLAGCGYAVLNVNYRLVDGSGLFEFPMRHKTSTVKVKDQVADLSAVVDFAVAHAKEWVVSSRRIAIAGHSAGGSLALLYGYDARNKGKIQAVANFAGALDLVFTNVSNWETLPNYVLEAGFRYTGFPAIVANEEHYKAISPLYVANADRKVSTFNVFPENNEVMGLPLQDLDTFTDFTSKLNVLKVPNKLLFVPGGDHNFSKTSDWELVLDSTVAYFNKNIK